MQKLSFEVLNNTKFALPQSEIFKRSGVRYSVASLREGLDVYKKTCKVVSSV